MPPAAAPRAFRPDINGLRAIAILTVMGFHFGVPGMAGGFAGVDVFYVISGYLMTGIVASRLAEGRFSLVDFYVDRACRIIPALAVLLAATLALGLLLPPGEYAITGKNVMMAALFASNIRFKTDYFGVNIDQEWLLHTWSLSLEWQYYVIFPLAVWAAWRLGGRKALLAVLAAGLALSLGLSLWLTQTWPTAAFYLLPSRGWELLAGGLVWFAPAPRAAWGRALQLGGLALIAASAVLVSEKGWPGWQALAPVAGTVAVIAARQTESLLTGNPAFAWLGLNSYSIYLWHWPVSLWTAREHPGEPLWIAGAVALSLALGHLSYRLIETWPRRIASRRRAALIAVTALGMLAAAGFAVQRSDGFAGRFTPEVARVAKVAAETAPYPAPCFSVLGGVPAPCSVGTGPARLILIGDSQAASAFAGVQAAAAPGALAFNAYAGCMPVLGAVGAEPQSRCGDFNRAFLPPLMQPRSTPVLLVAHWQSYFDDGGVRIGSRTAPHDRALLEARLQDTVCRLTAAGPTWLSLPVPVFTRRVPRLLESALIAAPSVARAEEVSMPRAEYLRSQGRARDAITRIARACGAGLVDPAAVLCRGERCMGSGEHRPFYYDKRHLAPFGSRQLAPIYAPILAGKGAP